MMERPAAWSRAALTFVLASLAVGCASEKIETTDTKATGLSKERVMLSEGYSILYHDAGSLDLAELVLYVKSESDAMKEIVTAIAEAGSQLKKDLERIDKDYPGVRLDLEPLPEMEKRKRAAITKDRMRYFAPIVGKGGREYERTMLLSYSNGLNHERHLCEVMAAAEPDPGLRKFLLDAQKRYDNLHARVTDLLEREYFKDPNGKTKD